MCKRDQTLSLASEQKREKTTSNEWESVGAKWYRIQIESLRMRNFVFQSYQISVNEIDFLNDWAHQVVNCNLNMKLQKKKRKEQQKKNAHETDLVNRTKSFGDIKFKKKEV